MFISLLMATTQQTVCRVFCVNETIADLCKSAEKTTHSPDMILSHMMRIFHR